MVVGVEARPDGRGPYDAVVFAGGGCRCFWQAGFWLEAAPALGIEPRVAGAVSAGAALACALFAGVAERVVEDFTRRVAANGRNAYPANALRHEPVFPHGSIYHSTLKANLDDEAFARLRRGPDVRVSVAKLPPGVGPRAAFGLALVAYLADRSRESRVHGIWGRKLGFRNEFVSIRECASPAELADLILQSSSTPPVTPYYRRRGEPVLDGGLVDGVPVGGVGDARRTLVLLSRRFPEGALPRAEGRTYVQPSEEIPVHKWDYTSPEPVRRTFELGRRDGEAFAARATRTEAA